MEKDFYPAYFKQEGLHWWFIGRRAIFLRLLDSRIPNNRRPVEVLDFGCGTGAFLEYLERFGKVRAVDGDEDAVAFCHMRGRLDVELAPPDSPLPFPEASFDLVTALDVIEHIEDDVGALKELHRVMRPDSLLLVAVPAFQFLWGDQDEISHHFRRYNSRGLKEVLESAGFDVEHSSYFNTWMFPPIALIRVIRRLVRPPTDQRTDFDVGPKFLNGILARLFASEAIFVARGALPVGVSLLALARKRQDEQSREF